MMTGCFHDRPHDCEPDGRHSTTATIHPENVVMAARGFADLTRKGRAGSDDANMQWVNDTQLDSLIGMFPRITSFRMGVVVPKDLHRLSHSSQLHVPG